MEPAELVRPIGADLELDFILRAELMLSVSKRKEFSLFSRVLRKED